MHSDALLAASRRGEELRYVTEHFRDLQGLRSVTLWIASLLLAGLAAMTRLSHRQYVGMTVLVLLLFFAVWRPWIDRWYKRHYGTVMGTSSQSDTLRIYLLMLFLLAMVVAGVLFGSLKSYLAYPGLWPVFLALPAWFWPTMLFTLPGSLQTASIPIRVHRLLYMAGNLAVLFLIVSFPFLHLSAYLVNAILSGTFLALSLYDHWLLNYLLTGNHGSFL